MKILHIDDHKIFTQGLALALEDGLEDTRVLCGHSAAEALAELEAHPDIDLVMLDLSMPGIDGLGLIDALNERDLALPIVVMSAVDDPWQIRDCLHAGAVGFIPKTFGQTEIIAALKQIVGGDIYVPEALRERLSRLPEKYVPESERVAKGLHLNKRQMDVLELMQRGYSNREIAEILSISENTVKSHARVLYQALDVGSRLECVREAERHGLI
jgi:DNA-binding NarL/FixJ family response regulator